MSHWLQGRRDKYQMKIEAEREFRKKLTEGISPNIYSKGMEKLFTMIDEGKLPRSHAMDQKLIDELLSELQAEENLDS